MNIYAKVLALVGRQESQTITMMFYRHPYQSSSPTLSGKPDVPRTCWNSHRLLVGLRKHGLFRNCTPTQMELPHGHRKNVYSRAVLKSSCWKQPSELCRVMVYSDIDITQQIQMNSLQVHTTLWMSSTNMLSDISQT